MSGSGLVIVGGSYAAIQLAASARELGYSEPIKLISNEDVIPYHRPPLSKAYLLGKAAESTLPIRAEKFFADNNVEVLLSTEVVSIERGRRQVRLSGGLALDYDRLALTVGARPRPLQVIGSELEGIFELRNLADARRLRRAMEEVQSVVVVGAGFIGLEVASVLASLGKPVTVLEAGPRILARSAAVPLADYISTLHKSRGVDLRLNCTVQEMVGHNGRVSAVRDSDGRTHTADMVIVGIGVVPNLELAQAYGLPCAGGIEVDRFARTLDPGIYGAGDCTTLNVPGAAQRLRLESVQNAIDQAKAAAAGVAGRPAPYDPVPWFWSDQFATKVQMVGLSGSHDAYEVRGSVESGKFSIFYFSRGALCAVDSINRPADHMLARRLMNRGASVSVDQVRDLSFDLSTVLKD